MKAPELKPNDNLQRLLEAHMQEGLDVSIRDNHTTVEIWLQEPCVSIAFHQNGKWELQ